MPFSIGVCLSLIVVGVIMLILLAVVPLSVWANFP